MAPAGLELLDPYCFLQGMYSNLKVRLQWRRDTVWEHWQTRTFSRTGHLSCTTGSQISLLLVFTQQTSSKHGKQTLQTISQGML